MSRAAPILEATTTLDIRADPARLRPGEREAVTHLMAVGETFHTLFEDARHPDSSRVWRHLSTYSPSDAAEREHVDALRRLHRVFRGPVISDLDGERLVLGPIRAWTETGGLYPEGLTEPEVRAAAEAHPDAGLLEPRTLVRRRTVDALDADRAALERHPLLAALHPEVADALAAPPDRDAVYAVPYAIAYADAMVDSADHLRAAARAVRGEDEDLADYLEQRGRDLLTNDYEAGDAIWVNGRTERLDAQIGAYESYDDLLLGLKTLHSLSILIRDVDGSSELEAAVARLQDFQDALPGAPYGAVRARVPIGIFEVLADYGHTRRTHTASILPNEARVVRRHGRTILIRKNLMTHPVTLASAQARYRAVVAPEHAGDLGPRGEYDRTVWHEVGHYLGPTVTTDGRPLGEALGTLHNTFEELKADLVSLWLVPRLQDAGVLDAPRARGVYAAGVLRTLLSGRPSRSNPYGTMELMQQRFFLEHGSLAWDGDAGRLRVSWARVPEVALAMVTEVLRIQRTGDAAQAERFVERWAGWDDSVQGRIAAALRDAAPRFRLLRYEALEGR